MKFLIKMYTNFLFIIFTLSSVAGSSSIHPVLNPGCDECIVNDTILIYIKAEDDSLSYIIHQLWDFTGHVPTMLYIMGNRNSTVDVQWDGNKPSQIVSDGSFYSFAMILNNLIEYNDTNPYKVYFNYTYPHREISLRDVSWRLDDGVLTADVAKVRVRGALSLKKHGMKGYIDFKMTLLPNVGRSQSLPRLYHSVNSTQVDVSLAGLTVSPEYQAGRFALKYVLVSQDGADGQIRRTVQRSIDDEYTPGVFETISLSTPEHARDGRGGFVQYRPVAYTERARDVESSVTAYVHNHNRTTMPHCLVERYYAHFNESLFVDELVASFGQNGDGFYKKTNYTVWTYAIGYGTPPAERISVFLVVMLVLGIGTPVAAMLCSYLVTRGLVTRHRQRLLDQEA